MCPSAYVYRVPYKSRERRCGTRSCHSFNCRPALSRDSSNRMRFHSFFTPTSGADWYHAPAFCVLHKVWLYGQLWRPCILTRSTQYRHPRRSPSLLQRGGEILFSISERVTRACQELVYPRTKYTADCPSEQAVQPSKPFVYTLSLSSPCVYVCMCIHVFLHIV